MTTSKIKASDLRTGDRIKVGTDSIMSVVLVRIEDDTARLWLCVDAAMDTAVECLLPAVYAVDTVMSDGRELRK